MRVETDAGSGGGESLYAEHKKVYPQDVQGTFRKIKWGILIACLGLYYILPFVRWDRGPNAPDQAVLIDFPGRRFYFFFIEIWPQEFYFITGLLIIAAFTLFLMNAVAGRVWCGYLCPQTVWTDLYVRIEALIEGDRRERIRLDQGPWTAMKVAQKVAKHTLWILVAWWTGGAWVLYFADAPTLVKDLATGQAPVVAYVWIGILTATTYALAGFMREQVCIYMCPWPRIQAALTDEWALNVSYRVDRGEPRGSLKSNKKLKAEGLPAGDCVDCGQCVVVCPTGTDIRLGSQLSCIQCGLCIDACNNVMDKVGSPRGLIAYDTDINIDRRKHGKEPIIKLVRVRTLIYVGLILGIAGFMSFTLLNRGFADVNVLHDRNPIFVQNSDGSVRNGYTVRLLNKRTHERTFVLSVEGLPTGIKIEAVGIAEAVGGKPLVVVGPDQTREIRVNVIVPKGVPVDKSTNVTFRITDTSIGEMGTAKDFFKAP